MTAVEDSLALAALATASTRGSVAVSLDAGYRLNHGTHSVTIDTSSEVGEEMNRVFYGFVEREFGRDAFAVQQLRGGLDSGKTPRSTDGEMP